MSELVASLEWWHWLVLGMLLMIVEIIAPASFFLWIAIAAFIMTLVTLLLSELSWQLQFILFGALSVASLLAGRAWFKRRPIASDMPQLNRRAEQYIGRTFTLTEPIENGYGTVHVDDTRWRVSGPALPAGKAVHVVGIDGTIFRVEAAPH